MAPDPADKKQALDFANYFISYGYLYHQKDMLQDRGRMDGYRNAILQNPGCFKDKVVLDVGTGSGVLAIWAAMAGAKRVYAVEATSMAQQARKLVAQNGFQEVVVVLEGYMEQVELPEKVDIIVSEWMGYYLLRESMFDSVLFARSRWLKPGGAHFPSHAQIFMAPLQSALYNNRIGEYKEEVAQWASFGEYMSSSNGIDVSGLSSQFGREQFEYIMQTAQWCQVQGAEVIGGTFEVIDFCVETVDIEELRCIRSSFSVEIFEAAELSGFGGWFDVQFSGSEASPAPSPVTLSTAPGSPTHWAQQVFLVSPPQQVERGDVLAGCVTVRRQKQNHRLLWVQIRFTHSRAVGPEQAMVEIQPERTLNFRIE